MSRKIIFEDKFPTTPEILFGALHDYWLQKASLLQETAISGLQFNLEKFDEHFYRIYIQQGSSKFGIISNIDVRRMNDQVIQITIIGTEENNRFYADQLWHDISNQVDQFLMGFVKYLKDYSIDKDIEEDQEAKANANKWEKMSKETQKKFTKAWKIYEQMCEEYEADVLDGASKTSRPSTQDFRSRVVNQMHWTVGDRRLRTIITYGKAGIIK